MEYRAKIKNYVTTQLASGAAIESIKQDLIEVGWEKDLVVEIVREVAFGERPPSPNEFTSEESTQPLSNRHLEIQPINPVSLAPEPTQVTPVSSVEQEPSSSSTLQAEY